jgi:group I intron endonuclease
MVIYKATNNINGKSYIGSTVHKLSRRISGHKSRAKLGSNLVFHRAIRKYSIKNFEWKILSKASSVSEMLKMESIYIKEHKTLKNGYNSTPGYDNTTLGYKFTDKQKSKMKKLNKGENNPNYGNKWSDKQKEEQSIRQKESHKHLKGDNNPAKRDGVRRKISENLKGSRNGMSKLWEIIKPNGDIIILHGGLKRFLKENDLTYSKICNMIKKKTTEYKGWKINDITKR